MANFVVYFFGGGLAFFVGAGCVLVALWMSSLRRHWVRVSTTLSILGLTLVVLSGTPLPIWFYAIAVALTLACLIATRLETSISPRRQIGMRVAVALLWLGAIVVEAPYSMLPTVSPAGHPRLYLFGDSLSAGLNGDPASNWPDILACAHSLDVSNFSIAGATTAMALRRANKVTLGDGIVLLEIGGNDLLGSTTGEDFEHDLEQLLQRVCQPGRQVMMFELPIPPFRNDFGRIQRSLASRHHVLLIPKRILIDVLTEDGATLDSIHLTRRGHERMADKVWEIIRSGYESPNTLKP